MLLEMSHSYFIINGETINDTGLRYEAAFEGKVLYEVIRIMKGKVLFLEGHLDRLDTSIDAIEGQRVDKNLLRKKIELYIEKVIDLNGLRDNNIKILLGNIDGDSYDLAVHGNPSYYPPQEIYRRGIDTACVLREREDPNVKAVNDDLANMIAKLKEETNIFEALLVDRNGNITEGSKSNVFFMSGDKLITPTVGTVLPGITRREVMATAHELNLEIVERDIKLEEVMDGSGNIDASFLTGTSLHILPIRKIDDRSFDFENSSALKMLMKAFEKKVEDAIDGQ